MIAMLSKYRELKQSTTMQYILFNFEVFKGSKALVVPGGPNILKRYYSHQEQSPIPLNRSIYWWWYSSPRDLITGGRCAKRLSMWGGDTVNINKQQVSGRLVLHFSIPGKK